MAKRPFPGRTKTRLCPPLTAAGAAALYECFLRDTLDLARSVVGVRPFVAFAPENEAVFFEQLAPDLGRVPQRGQTLGDRLDFVLTHCLNAGYGQVVAMNSDSPTLPPDYVAQAFSRLAEAATDVVLGPCDDGGYYLIGWKRPYSRLVREVEMSTPHVLEDTLTIAGQEGLRVALLPTWYDVDDAATLKRLQADLMQAGRHTQGFIKENGRFKRNGRFPGVPQFNT